MIGHLNMATNSSILKAVNRQKSSHEEELLNNVQTAYKLYDI